MKKAYYHLPGLFEFYALYKVFLPLLREHREYFYDWCEIGSISGAPGDCLWGGGRVGFGEADPRDVADLMKEYGISYDEVPLREDGSFDLKGISSKLRKETKLIHSVLILQNRID